MKREIKKLLSIVLSVMIVFSCFAGLSLFTAQAEETSISAIDVVSTTRKTYTLDTLDGITTNTDAVIENGAVKFSATKGSKFVFDFPLRNGKTYGVAVAFGTYIDGVRQTAADNIRFNAPSKVGFGSLDATSEGTELALTVSTVARDAVVYAGSGTMHANYKFTVGDSAITDVNNRYLYLLFNADNEAVDIVIESVTVFEQGAYAEIDFTEETDVFYEHLSYGTMDTQSGEYKGKGNHIRIFPSFLIEAGKDYEVISYVKRDNYTGEDTTAKSKYDTRFVAVGMGYPDSGDGIQVVWKREITDTYTRYTNTKGGSNAISPTDAQMLYGTGTVKLHGLSVRGEFATRLAQETITYDSLTIYQAGKGTVKFAGDVTAEDVTGYYGQSVTLPAATAGYRYEWYVDADFNEKIDGATFPASGETLTLYAKQVYDVKYDALNAVSTTRKTYSFDNMDGVVTNSGAIIENGAMTFTVAEGNKFVFDFPLRNGKSYGISMVFSIDDTTAELEYFYSGPKVIGSSAFDATAAVNGVEFSYGRSNDSKLFSGDKLHTQFLFSIPEGTITDNNSKYTSIELCRDATKAAMGKKMYLDSVTIFEVGAYAEFNFNDDSEFFWHYSDELDTANGEYSTSKTGSQARFALSYFLEADKTYTYAYRQKAVPTTATAVSKFTFAILSSKMNSYHTNKSIASTYPTPTTEYVHTSGSFTTTSTNVTSDSNALYINPNNIQGGYMVYDYIRVGLKGGTVKFVGDVTADDVTGYYGQSVTLPKAPTGYTVKWYYDEEMTAEIDGITIPAEGETVTIYSKAVRNDVVTYDFSSADQLDFGFSSEISEKALVFTANSGDQARARLPFEFVAGEDYYITFDYSAQFTDPTENAAYNVKVVYAADWDSWKMTGDDMYTADQKDYTGDVSKSNIQAISNFNINASNTSGTHQVAFKAPAEFVTLYNNNTLTNAYIMKYLGIRVQPGNCTSATLTIDNVTIGLRSENKTPAAALVTASNLDSVTLSVAEGCEYRISGGVWQDSTTFTGLLQGATYTFEKRVKESLKVMASESALTQVSMQMSGDHNTDNKLDSADLIALRTHLLGDANCTNTDANADDTTDARDIVNLKKYIANNSGSAIMMDTNNIMGYKVYSDSNLITTQARDELVEAINSRQAGAVEAIDEIGDNTKVIKVELDYTMDTYEYKLFVENGVLKLVGGSDSALLEGARRFAIILNSTPANTQIRMTNGYVLSDAYASLEYQGNATANNYSLVFSDEFQSNEINTDMWNAGSTWYRTYEDSYITYDPQYVSTDSDNMVISCGYDDNESYIGPSLGESESGTGTQIVTDGAHYGASIATTKAFKYGYYEARVKLPTEGGVWGGFWINGWSSETYHHNEVDIMETFGKISSATGNLGAQGIIHSWSNIDGMQKEGVAKETFGIPLDGEYHIYALEWTSEILRFFMDGECYFEVDLVNSEYAKYLAPLREGKDITVRFDAVGLGINEEKHHKVIVDYIRVYQ